MVINQYKVEHRGLHLKNIFCSVRCARSLVFCVVFCRLLFVLFLLATALSDLRFTASDYPFGIFKLFFSLVYGV